MNTKLILICAIIVQVHCDCDGLECLSGYLKKILSDKNSTETISDINNYNDSDDNTTSLIDVNDRRNSSLTYFDITELGKSFNQALVDVTKFIKDGLAGMFNFDQEVDVRKDDNDTEIYVKAFGLSKIMEMDNNLTMYDFSNVHVNNFTEFNDDFEALKVEIEQNLQAELEAFISKITENDTLDWDEVATSLSNKLDSRIKEELKEITTSLPEVSEVNNSVDNLKENNNEVNEPLKVSIDINTTSEIDTNKSAEDVLLSANSSNDVITTIAPPVNITKVPKTVENHITTEDEAIKINRDSLLSTPMPFMLTSKIGNIKTMSTTTTTQKPTEMTPIIDNAVQTKAPIDFNLIKNVKLNEITKEDVSYYEILDDNSTDYPIIDYVDLYKDTTNEDVEYKPTEIAVVDTKSDPDLTNYLDKGSYINDTTNPGSIFPWIATIFIKNSSNSQFDYYCDGVLLSETVVITAARCLLSSNVTVNADDVLVFLGKTSLLSSGEGEEIHKVKRLTLHENFTSTPEVTSNDLAALQLENPAVFNERIQAACLLKNGESSEAITTAWDASLSPIRFVEKNKTCEKNPTENTFCATFGNNVALCPSYGGVYASLSSESWCVQGLRMADPTSTGYCLEKTIAFTDLRKYSEWIDDALNKELF